MIVYTNDEDRIVAYGDTTTIPYKDKIEVYNYFDGKCNKYITGFYCKPYYKISNYVDDEPIYELDEDGNKIIESYDLYPAYDSKELHSMQQQYEEFLIMSADLIGGAYE